MFHMRTWYKSVPWSVMYKLRQCEQGCMVKANLRLSSTVFIVAASYCNLAFYHHIFHFYISLRNRGILIYGQSDTHFASLHGNSVEEEREQISLVWYSPLQLSTLLPNFYASFPPKDTFN